MCRLVTSLGPLSCQRKRKREKVSFTEDGLHPPAAKVVTKPRGGNSERSERARRRLRNSPGEISVQNILK